jgi:YidC/Oxa1 family membrane protein insertase
MSWSLIVDVVRALVFSASHLFGNSVGGGVLFVSLAVRVALLPITLRAARRQLAHQRAMARLKPELDAINRRHAGDRTRLAEATMALYQRHDVTVLPPGTFGSLLVQAPVGAALYQAVAHGLGKGQRFLWAVDLARPDALIAAGAATLAGVAVAAAPSSNRTAIAISTILTFVFAWRLSASVGLYWLASNGVGVMQSLLLRRTEPAV